MTNAERRQATQVGYSARQSGKTVEDCPYMPILGEREKADAWLIGWWKCEYALRESPHPERFVSRTVQGNQLAQALAASLTAESVSFHCEPLPDEDYLFTVKADASDLLDNLLVSNL